MAHSVPRKRDQLKDLVTVSLQPFQMAHLSSQVGGPAGGGGALQVQAEVIVGLFLQP